MPWAVALLVGTAVGADGGHEPGSRMPAVRTEGEPRAGSVDKEVIGRVMRQGMGGIRHCYERPGNTDAGLPSLVQLGFTIGSAGTVTATHIQCRPACEELTDCLDAALRRLRFPPDPDGGSIQVSYPLNIDAAGP